LSPSKLQCGSPQKYRHHLAQDGRHLNKRHWGLVPFWAKDTSIGSRIINARAETVASKSAFRTAIKQRRCLIPATGSTSGLENRGTSSPIIFILLPGNRCLRGCMNLKRKLPDGR
jgi:hypothetical protein